MSGWRDSASPLLSPLVGVADLFCCVFFQVSARDVCPEVYCKETVNISEEFVNWREVVLEADLNHIFCTQMSHC